MTITLSMATLIYVASCITVIGGAIKILSEAKKSLQKPLEDIEKKLKDHDQFLANDKDHLDKIDYALEDLTRSFNMLVKSNRIILDHLVDGNHTGEIQAELKEIDDWLMEGKRYKK